MNKFIRKTPFGRLLRHRSGTIGLALVLFFIVVAIFAPLIAPYSPIEQNSKSRLQPPGGAHIFGTDEFGRDVLSRLMNGATNSLQVALIAVAVSGIVGTLLGLVSGYWGGLLDNLIMRLMDLIFAFPAMLLALAISAALGPGLGNTILAISIVYLPIFARVARGSVMTIKQLEYIDATRCLGGSDQRILFRHVLPNSLTPTIVQVSLALSWAMLTEAALSFLGLGTVPPMPSWGAMLNDARRLMELAPWLAIAPGTAIMLGVLGFNLLGDGLRDILDPRLRSMVK